MSKPSTFTQFIRVLRSTLATFPDQRTGKNKHYALVDAAVGAFAVFFTQSPSFLAYPRDMTARKGQSNAHTRCGRGEIPSDHQMRALLDPVRPALVVPVFPHGVATLEHTHQLVALRSWQKRLLVVLEGTPYFSAQKISCPQCSTQHHANGTVTSSQRRLTPGIVAPGQDKVIPLPPEFMVPQDGHDKQDCENAAATRWLRKYAQYYRAHGSTILGDALYSNYPRCEVLAEEGVPFILVCTPDAPPTLYEQLAGRELGQDRHQVTHRHHPPRPGTDDLYVSLRPSAPLAGHGCCRARQWV